MVLKHLIIFVIAFHLAYSILERKTIEFSMAKVTKEKIIPIKYHIRKDIFSIKSYIVSGATLVDLVHATEGLYSIKLSVGSSFQEFDLIVDTGSCLLWIAEDSCVKCGSRNKFIQKNSKTFLKTPFDLEVSYVTGKIYGTLSQDQIQLGKNISMSNFGFLLSKNADTKVAIDGIVGFARTYLKYDEKYSLIDSLYKNGAIAKRMFSQKLDDLGESKLYLGNYPSEVMTDFSKFSKCKCINNNPNVQLYWACNLNKVLFSSYNDININGNSFIDFSHQSAPAIFDTGANIISAPSEYFSMFKDLIFAEALAKGTCFTLKDKSGMEGFQCYPGTIFSFKVKTLSFMFDNGMKYEIPLVNLFNDYNGLKIFHIVFLSIPGRGWLLGQPFLKHFIVTFDKDDDSVGFYPKSEDFTMSDHIGVASIKPVHLSSEKDTSAENSILIYLVLIGAMILVICSVIFLGITLKKCRRRQDATKEKANDLNSKFLRLSPVSSL